MKKFSERAFWLVVLLWAVSPSTHALELRKEIQSGNSLITVKSVRFPDRDVPVSQRISHGRFQELRVDNDFDGIVDVWEISTPGIRIRYSLPDGGKFRRLETERRGDRGDIVGEFLLSRDGKEYQLVASRIRPFKTYYREADPVAKCRVVVPGIGVEALAADAVSIADPTLPQKIARSAMIDASCEQEPFKSDKSTILAAVQEVVGSADADKGRFLSCLRGKGLGYYADRLDEEFDQMLADKKASVFCEETDDAAWGSYSNEPDQGGEKISFHKPHRQDGNQPDDGKNYYSRVFFHEALHRAGLLNEHLVHSIENCCSYPTTGIDSAGSCQDMEDRVRKENFKNAYLTAFSKYLPGFSDLMKEIAQSKDTSAADTMFTDYMNSFEGFRARAGKVYSDCTGAKNSGFEKALKGEVLQDRSHDACFQFMLQAVEQDTRKYFTESCPHFFVRTRQKTSICGKLEEHAIELIRNSAKTECTSPSGKKGNCLDIANEEGKEAYESSWNPKDQVTKVLLPEGISYLDLRKDQQARAYRERMLNSYLNASEKYLPGIKGVWDEMKDSADPDRVQAMMSALFKNLQNIQSRLDARLAMCKKLSPWDGFCASRAKDRILRAMDRQFSKACPSYFTREENGQKLCEGYRKSIVSILEKSMSGGCQEILTGKKSASSSAAPDITCFSRALSDGQACFENYENDPKCRENTLKSLHLGVPEEEQRETANRTSSAPVRIYAPYDPASATVIDFDPDNLGEVERTLALRNRQAGETVAAGDGVSDYLVRRAVAAGTQPKRSTASVATREPVEIPDPVSGKPVKLNYKKEEKAAAPIAGNLPAAPKAGTGEAESAGPVVTPPSKKADRIQEKSLAEKSRTGEKQAKRAPASAGAASKGKGSAQGGVASSETGARDPGRSPASAVEDPKKSSQRQLILKYYTQQAREAHGALLDPAVEQGLQENDVEVCDLAGKAHGARSPVMRIRYVREGEARLSDQPCGRTR